MKNDVTFRSRRFCVVFLAVYELLRHSLVVVLLVVLCVAAGTVLGAVLLIVLAVGIVCLVLLLVILCVLVIIILRHFKYLLINFSYTDSITASKTNYSNRI